jgi:cation transporter-like permease
MKILIGSLLLIGATGFSIVTKQSRFTTAIHAGVYEKIEGESKINLKVSISLCFASTCSY